MFSGEHLVGRLSEATSGMGARRASGSASLRVGVAVLQAEKRAG